MEGKAESGRKSRVPPSSPAKKNLPSRHASSKNVPSKHDSSKNEPSRPDPSKVKESTRAAHIFDMLETAVQTEGAALVKMGDAILQIVISDGEKCCIDLKNGSGAVYRGEGEEPDATLTTKDEDFVALAHGKLDPVQAFASGKMSISGDTRLVERLGLILHWAEQFAAKAAGV